MSRRVKAIYHRGVLELKDKLELPENREVTIVVIDDDPTSEEIAEVAAAGKSFDFLADVAEDVYTRDDGEPV